MLKSGMKFGKIHYALTAAVVKCGARQDVTEMRREDGRNGTGLWRLPKKQSEPKSNRPRSHPGMAPPPNSRTGNRSCGGAR